MLKALQPLGYIDPTPIQAAGIPHVLAGKDVLGCAQTGTGKTAAFALPMVHLLLERRGEQQKRRMPRGLILSPTRELATQISDNIKAYSAHTPLRQATIFGGVSQMRQVDAVQRGVDIIVATPGRLLDLINQGYVRLDAIEFFVLDEADTMLDMGFIHDIRRIIALLPEKRQSLFFSATMPDNILELADRILTEPVRVEVARISSPTELVEQTMYFVKQVDKRELLVHLVQQPGVESALVFTRTKHGADKVVKYLRQCGIESEAIHGNKSQPQRDKAMKGFRDGTIHVLVATDIAARGIDVSELSHVFNFELPNIPETYVHRIGRTGRAGALGKAISFCNEDEEREYLLDIQKLIQRVIPIEEDHPWHLDMEPIGLTRPPRGTGRPSSSSSATRSSGGGRTGGERGRTSGAAAGERRESGRPSGERGRTSGAAAGERREQGRTGGERGRTGGAAAGERREQGRTSGERGRTGGAAAGERREQGRPSGERGRTSGERGRTGGRPDNREGRKSGFATERSEPRQFGRTSDRPQPNRATEEESKFSLKSFLGFGKRRT
ncbi:MAG: hypothetical protein RJA19_671 [Bacteroidota bacterium]